MWYYAYKQLENDSANAGYNCFMFSHLIDDAEKENSLVSEGSSECHREEQEHQAESSKGELTG